ncbi:MAG: LolA family protein, partial [Thermodesulfobacteriota bacterium]
YRIQANPIAERYLFFTRDPFPKGLADWKIREEKESSLIMEVLPKEKESLFMSTRLLISKEKWMVMGMELVERNGDTTILRYSNIRINTGLTDSDFEICLPKNVKVREIK